MSNTTMTIDEDTFKSMPTDDKLWLIFSNYGPLEQRVKKLENRRLWDSAKIVTGSLIGGAAAALGMRWGGFR